MIQNLMHATIVVLVSLSNCDSDTNIEKCSTDVCTYSEHI